MYDAEAIQYEVDYLTGHPTSITGTQTSPQLRSACTTLNRRRARGLCEAAGAVAPRQQGSIDAWSAAVKSRWLEWGVPIVSLRRLGLSFDQDHFLTSTKLTALKPGAEASPYADKEKGIVLKLFHLHITGGLGKTFSIQWDEGSQSFETVIRDATLAETLEKLCAMHDAGAHPTEVVGITDGGNYLIVKQPLALPYWDLERDRYRAVEQMKAVPCAARFKTAKWIFWVEGQAYAMSDLHQGNIMRDADNHPTVIDALVAPLDASIIAQNRQLQIAVAKARCWRLNLPYDGPKAFDEVNDDDL